MRKIDKDDLLLSLVNDVLPETRDDAYGGGTEWKALTEVCYMAVGRLAALSNLMPQKIDACRARWIDNGMGRH